MRHNKRRTTWKWILALLPELLPLLGGCGGKVVPLSHQGLIGDAVIVGTGGSRVDGSDIGDIYAVTNVIVATGGNPYSTTAELPFTGPMVTIGQSVTDGQTAFHYNYSYPQNNYKLGNAHIVIDTS